MIGERIGRTMLLGFLAILFALIISIPMGTLAAMRPNSLIDRLALVVAVIGQALPTFWFALMMMIVFGIWWRMLPISGHDEWAHYVMPTIALGYYATPALMRLTRAGMIEVLSSDYIRTARAKGLSPASVLFKHALRNAIIPVVALAAVWFGFMLEGWAAKATEPLHWAIYAAGAYGFWKMRRCWPFFRGAGAGKWSVWVLFFWRPPVGSRAGVRICNW